MKWPPTRSGKATVCEITDQDAIALQPGEILLHQMPYGLAPLVVETVKIGIAGDIGESIEVPVVVGAIPGRKTLSYAIPDCLTLKFE